MSETAFEEKKRELDALLAELDHCLWERGIPSPSAASAPCDHEAFLSELVEQLERDVNTLPARRSVALLAAILIRVTQARLRSFIALAATLSEPERRGLAALVRLSEEQRRTIGALLRLPDSRRREVAIILGLSDVENNALAAFIDDGEAEAEDSDIEAGPEEISEAVVHRMSS